MKKITKENGLVVLSLFDGMSCGRLGLEQAHIKIDKYLASEIKPFAIEHTLKHYPDTIAIGDVTKVYYNKYKGILYMNCERKVIDSLANYTTKKEWTPKELAYFRKHHLEVCDNGEVYKWYYKKASIAYVGKIDLLIGGSPCQQFSSGYYFSKDPAHRGLKGNDSKLFYEYLRLLKETNPTHFFLENVKMELESEQALNDYLKVEGIHINSNLLTYQNRARIYWTNIRGINVPDDKNVNFQDYLIKTLPRVEEILHHNKFNEDKLPLTLTNKEIDTIVANNKWVYDELASTNPSITKREVVNIIHEQLSETIAKKVPFRDKMLYGDANGKYKNKCLSLPTSTKIGALTLKQDRNPCSGIILFHNYYRYLTTLEQARAQGVPFDFVRDMSWTKNCNTLGDGWSIPVVAHCFSFLHNKYDFR